MNLSLRTLTCLLMLALVACDNLPVNSSISTQATQTAPAGPGSFRWTVLVDTAVADGKTASWRKPLTLQQLQSVEVGGMTILATQIETRSALSPQASAAQQEIQARAAALKQTREETMRRNAAAAEERKKQAEARYNEQKAAQQKRYQDNLANLAKPSPKPTPTASPAFTTQAETASSAPVSPVWRLSYLNNGQFQLESNEVPSGPLIVKMRLEGFTEPVTVPLVRQSAPLLVTAARNAQGQTIVTGSFSQTPTRSQQEGLFTIQPDATGGQSLDWTSPDGSQRRYDLDALPSSGIEDPSQAEALPSLEQDVASQQFADIDQMFADLERSFTPMPTPADNWPGDNGTSTDSQDSQSDDEFFSQDP